METNLNEITLLPHRQCYPCPIPRYVIHNDMSISPSLHHDGTGSHNLTSKLHSINTAQGSESLGSLNGLTSVLYISQSNTILQTCGHTDHPSILTITKLHASSSDNGEYKDDKSALSTIEIDLNELHECQLLSTSILKTFITKEKLNYKIIIVDSLGHVLIIRLNQNTLLPNIPSSESSNHPRIHFSNFDEDDDDFEAISPSTAVQYISTSKLLQDHYGIPIINIFQNNHNIYQSNLISIIDSNRLIFAIHITPPTTSSSSSSPAASTLQSHHHVHLPSLNSTNYLFCLDTRLRPHPKIVFWNEGKCLQLKRKSLGGLLQNVKGILSGKSEMEMYEEMGGGGSGAEGGDESRMDEDESGGTIYGGNQNVTGSCSIVSLCTVQQGIVHRRESNDDDDDEERDESTIMSNAVCTLHSDGSLRMWILLPSSNILYPLRTKLVYTLDQVALGEHIPPPHTWDYSHEMISMTAKSYYNDLSTAVSSRKKGNFHYVIGLYINSSNILPDSPSKHLAILEGVSDVASNRISQVRKFVVPNQVTSLTGMDFMVQNNPQPSNLDMENNAKWQLRVLYKSKLNSVQDLDQPLLATYQTDSLHPHVSSSQFTFDAVLAEERNSLLQELQMVSQILYTDTCKQEEDKFDPNNTTNSSKEEWEFTLIDSWYMKRLFRSSSVRVGGGQYISDSSIRKALYKMNMLDTVSLDHRSNIEVETLMSIRNWAKRTITCMDGDSTPQQVSEDDCDEEMLDANNKIYKFNESGQIAYLERWKQILITAFEEEIKLSTLLSFFGFPHSGDEGEVGLIVRANYTSICYVSKHEKESVGGAIEELDKLCLNIIQEVRRSDLGPDLAKNELKIWDIIAEAGLVVSSGKNDVDQIIDHFVSRLDSASIEETMNNILDILQSMTSDEVDNWLRSSLSSSSWLFATKAPGIPLWLSKDSSTKRSSQSNNWWTGRSASNLAQLYIDTIRRLTLARCLVAVKVVSVFSDENFNLAHANLAKRTYLHSTAVSWTCSQVAKVNVSSIRTDSGSRFQNIRPVSPTEPPVSRLKTSLNSKSPKYSVLECYLSEVLDTENHSLSLSHSVIELAQKFINVVFEHSGIVFTNVGSFEDRIVDMPRLSLRLLSPIMAYDSVDSTNDTYYLHNLNELTAHGILAELNASGMGRSFDSMKVEFLQKYASKLLLGKVPLATNVKLNDVGVFFNIMLSVPDAHVIANLNLESHDILGDTLHRLMNQDDVYVGYISKMESVQRLFMPWITSSFVSKTDLVKNLYDSFYPHVGDPQTLIHHMVTVFRQVYYLIQRVTILERHSVIVSETTPSSKISTANIVLSAIKDATAFIEKHFPKEVYETHLVEYSMLSLSAFRHAILGKCWDDALQYCLINPIEERGQQNFRRLVISMVDSGDLGALIEIVKQSNDYSCKMNLYDIASKALGDAASHRANREHSLKYTGCLYALHAAHGQWQNSCQAMNYYGRASISELECGDCSQDEVMTVPSSINKRNQLNKALDIYSLATLACSHIIQNLPDPTERFIVKGAIEVNTNITDMICTTSEEKRSNKRGRDLVPFPNIPIENNFLSESVDTDSSILKEQDIICNARRSIVLRTLCMDALSPDSKDMIFNYNDDEIMDGLIRLGYYPQAISLAECKHFARKGVCLSGRNIVSDTVSKILCKYLVPISVKLSRPPPLDVVKSIDISLPDRPSLNQLRLSCTFSTSLVLAERWRSQIYCGNAIRGSTASRLIHEYVNSYANATNSIAMELAHSYIEEDNSRADLPMWLHESLSRTNDGLFGSKISTISNPAALLRLYIRKGMFVQACNVVCSVLLGHNDERQKQAPSRLPEKGGIDFVPYESIDMLWDAIESEITMQSCNPERKESIKHARDQMEKALEKHFEWMRISEMGLLSARALSS